MVNINLKKIETMLKVHNFRFVVLAVIGVIILTSFDKFKNEKLSANSLTYEHYRIIYGNYPMELESSINYYLKKGWIPMGGVVAQGDSFYQAIVK